MAHQSISYSQRSMFSPAEPHHPPFPPIADLHATARQDRLFRVQVPFTDGAAIGHLQTAAQAAAVEEVLAGCDASLGHRRQTDGTDVILLT